MSSLGSAASLATIYVPAQLSYYWSEGHYFKFADRVPFVHMVECSLNEMQWSKYIKLG